MPRYFRLPWIPGNSSFLLLVSEIQRLHAIPVNSCASSSGFPQPPSPKTPGILDTSDSSNPYITRMQHQIPYLSNHTQLAQVQHVVLPTGLLEPRVAGALGWANRTAERDWYCAYNVRIRAEITP